MSTLASGCGPAGFEGASLGLSPKAIEDELSRIRDRESNPFTAGTRTNLFTLVILSTGGTGPGTRVEGALEHIVGRRPARIITIEPGDGPGTAVTAGGRCSPDALDRGVCFEEIRIVSGSDGTGFRPAAWAPLLIRDLPVYAWWTGPLSSYPAELTEAAELLDKVIVDASYLSPGATGPENPYAGLAALARERRRARAVAFTDLGWRRTGSLRMQTARMFDAPEARDRLSAIQRVTLSGGTQMDAAELFLWLASRLGWKPERLEPEWARFASATGGRVDAVHDDGGPPGGFRISFSFSDGGGELAMTCRGNGCVAMGEETGVYRPPSDGEALMAELDSLEQDSLFAEVLDMAHSTPQQ